MTWINRFWRWYCWTHISIIRVLSNKNSLITSFIIISFNKLSKIDTKLDKSNNIFHGYKKTFRSCQNLGKQRSFFAMFYIVTRQKCLIVVRDHRGRILTTVRELATKRFEHFKSVLNQPCPLNTVALPQIQKTFKNITFG